MKHFLLIFSVYFIRSILFGQIVNNEWTYFDYTYSKYLIKNNNVETVTAKMYFSDGRLMGSHTFYFDASGVLTKQIIFDTSGLPLRAFYFTANKKKDLMLRRKIDYELKRSDTVRYFKDYTRDKLIQDSSSELPVCYHYEYDKNGILIKTLIYSNFGSGNSSRRVIVYTLNDAGRKINITETDYLSDGDKTGIVISNRNILYDSRGKIVSEVEKVSNENSGMANKGSIKYVYDSYGNLIQLLRTNAASYMYDYNSKGLITYEKMTLILDESKIETFTKYMYTYRR